MPLHSTATDADALTAARAIDRAAMTRVIWIPGYLSQGGRTTLTLRNLQSLYPSAAIEVIDWPSGDFETAIRKLDVGSWKQARAEAEPTARRLADELASRTDDELRTTAINGHSLGGHVTRRLLDQLAGRGRKVHHAVLFGAATEGDGTAMDWTSATYATQHGVFNVHDKHDGILRRLYRLAEGHHAAGRIGITNPPPRLYNVRVVTRHWLNRLETAAGGLLGGSVARAIALSQPTLRAAAVPLMAVWSIRELRRALTHLADHYVLAYHRLLDEK